MVFFFNDITLNKIYDDQGKFDFIYQISKILYSTIITSVINIIIKFLSLNGKKFLEIKKKKMKKIIMNYIISLLNLLYFLFLCFHLLYYFHIIYHIFLYSIQKHTSHLIKDTLISFGLSKLYPFFYFYTWLTQNSYFVFSK